MAAVLNYDCEYMWRQIAMKSRLSDKFNTIKTAETASFVEAIDSGCAMIEGIFSRFADKRDDVGESHKMTSDDMLKIREDSDTLDDDLEPYMNALAQLKELVWTYGPRLFNQIIGQPEFRKAYADGVHLDSVRKNPMIEAISAGREFAALIESASKLTDKATAMKAGEMIAESYTRVVFPMFEGPTGGSTVVFSDVSVSSVNVEYDAESDVFDVSVDIAFDCGLRDRGWDDSPKHYTGRIVFSLLGESVDWDGCSGWISSKRGADISAKKAALAGVFKWLEIEPITISSSWTGKSFDPKTLHAESVDIDFSEVRVTVQFAEGDAPESQYPRASLETEPALVDDIAGMQDAVLDAEMPEMPVMDESVAAPSKLDSVIGEGVYTSMKAVMDVIARFIAKHGVYTWNDFLRTDRWRDVYTHGGRALKTGASL